MTEFETAPDQEFDPNAEHLFAEPPKWPKVVGVVSIVFSALGLTCMGCVGVMLFVLLPMGEQQMGEPAPAAMLPTPIGYGLMFLGVLMAIVLLTAGIMTIGRKPLGRPLHLVWAGVSVPLTIVNIVMQFQQQTALQQWYQDNPGSQWAQQQQGPGGQLIGMAVGLVLGLGWPVFCLIWFGLVKTKPSDMTGAHDPADA